MCYWWLNKLKSQVLQESDEPILGLHTYRHAAFLFPLTQE